MQNIFIREAVPDDAKDIINVYYKTWLDTYPNDDLGITKDDIEDKYKNSFTEENINIQKERILNLPENQKRFVAIIDDSIVGVSSVIRDENFNQLKTIYVLPEYQGKGVGKKLWGAMKIFIDFNKDTTVNVATYNKKAIGFYENLGFIDSGKRWVDEKWKMRSGAVLPEMEMIIRADK